MLKQMYPYLKQHIIDGLHMSLPIIFDETCMPERPTLACAQRVHFSIVYPPPPPTPPCFSSTEYHNVVFLFF